MRSLFVLVLVAASLVASGCSGGSSPASDGKSPDQDSALSEDLRGKIDAPFTGDLNAMVSRRLIRAGVPTELHVYPGAFHGFDLDPNADISATARGDSLAALAVFMRGR